MTRRRRNQPPPSNQQRITGFFQPGQPPPNPPPENPRVTPPQIRTGQQQIGQYFHPSSSFSQTNSNTTKTGIATDSNENVEAESDILEDVTSEAEQTQYIGDDDLITESMVEISEAGPSNPQRSGCISDNTQSAVTTDWNKKHSGMSKHKRKDQKSILDSEKIYKAATLRKGKTRKRKAYTELPNKDLLKALQETMKKRLEESIRFHVNTGKNVENLKKKLKEAKVLPRDIKPDTDRQHNFHEGTTENFIRSRYKDTPGVQIWTDLIKAEFDSIHIKIKNEPRTQSSSSSSLSQDKPSSSKSQTPDHSSSSETQQLLTASLTSENIRTSTVPLRTIQKKENINQNVQDVFYKRIEETVKVSSDYSSNFGVLVYSIMMDLRQHCFIKDARGIRLAPYNDQRLSRFLPEKFQIEKDMPAPPPIGRNTILEDSSTSLKNDFDRLFTQNHLQNVHASYFGQKGVTQKTLNDHPLHGAIMKLIPKDDNFPLKTDAAPSIMASALATYITNFTNMWKSGNIFKKSLNNLLSTLLKVHLAPKRHQAYQEHVKIQKDKEKAQKTEKITRDRKRNKFRVQIYKENKYNNKADLAEDPNKKDKYLKMVEKCKERIQFYKQKFKPEDVQMSETSSDPSGVLDSNDFNAKENLEEEIVDGEEVVELGDVSGRRLNSLLSVTRSLLYSRKASYTTYDIKNKIPSITDNEANVCTALLSSISPYIPERRKMGIVAYQLPLVLLTNDILNITGYSGKRREICPLPSITSLRSYDLNATMIFNMFCSNPDEGIEIYDYKGEPIPSEQDALSNKDAIFDAFFDLKTIQQTCNDRGLDFIHNIHILPGGKNVRLVGVLKNPFASERVSINDTAKSNIQDPRITSEISKEKDILKSDIKLLDTEVSALERQLKNAYKERDNNNFQAKLKEEKKKWARPNTGANYLVNTEVLKQIRDIQSSKNDEIRRIQDIKDQISVSRSRRYVKQRALNIQERNPTTKPKTFTGKTQKKAISRACPFLYDKVENIDLKIKPEDCVFSGTDNGLKIMTSTVAIPFSTYNYYQVLHDEKDSDTSQKFKPIPKSFNITSNDIDVGTNEAYMRRWRNQRKRSSKFGEEVTTAEKELSQSSLKNASSYQEVFDMYQVHQSTADIIRDFYHSKHFNKKKRTNEIQKKKFKDTISSKERKYVVGANSKCEVRRIPVMMIGDRGTGVGSTIKGYNRYGGKWKAKIHGRYVASCVTNEHNSSQICAYCYRKIVHPKREKMVRGVLKKIDSNGSSICINPDCIAFKACHAVQSRDKQSALLIGLAGISHLLNGKPFPELDPHISHSKTDPTEQKPPLSGSRNEDMGTLS